MRSLLHVVCAFVSALVVLALLVLALWAVSFAVFGLLAFLLRIHPALGFAYACAFFALAVGFIVRDVRRSRSNA
jgi:hypothetical protein